MTTTSGLALSGKSSKNERKADFFCTHTTEIFLACVVDTCFCLSGAKSKRPGVHLPAEHEVISCLAISSDILLLKQS